MYKNIVIYMAENLTSKTFELFTSRTGTVPKRTGFGTLRILGTGISPITLI